MAEALIYALHGEALRTLSDEIGPHFEGVQAGARLARKLGRISDKMFKRLTVLDHAFSLQRHITKAKASQVMLDLERALASTASHTVNECTSSSFDEGCSSSDAVSTSAGPPTPVKCRNIVRENMLFDIFDDDVGDVSSSCASASCQTEENLNSNMGMPTAGSLDMFTYAAETLCHNLEAHAVAGLARQRSCRCDLLACSCSADDAIAAPKEPNLPDVHVDGYDVTFCWNDTPHDVLCGLYRLARASHYADEMNLDGHMSANYLYHHLQIDEEDLAEYPDPIICEHLDNMRCMELYGQSQAG